MKLLAPLGKPAVRIPLVMGLLLATSLWAAHSCRRQARMLRLARARHLSFIRLLASAASEAGKRPGSLGELVWRSESGDLSAVEKLFLRDYAGRPEFKEMADPGAEPLDRLGEIEVWKGSGERGREQEIVWSGYMFRLYPSPENGKDFVVFSWPLKKEPGQLTIAWLSTEPGGLYYTSAPRYVGPEAGPGPRDLGEAPFEGKIYLLSPDAVGDSPREFMEKAEEEKGRLWAREDLAVE